MFRAARSLANIAHHDFLGALRDEVIAFRKPVAYVHGDSHYFRIDKPFQDASGRSALTQGPLARSPRLVLGARDSALVGVSPQLGGCGLMRPLERRSLSIVGRSGMPWILRNSSAGTIRIVRPSPSRMVTGATASSSTTGLRADRFIALLPSCTVEHFDAPSQGRVSRGAQGPYEGVRLAQP